MFYGVNFFNDIFIFCFSSFQTQKSPIHTHYSCTTTIVCYTRYSTEDLYNEISRDNEDSVFQDSQEQGRCMLEFNILVRKLKKMFLSFSKNVEVSKLYFH